MKYLMYGKKKVYWLKIMVIKMEIDETETYENFDKVGIYGICIKSTNILKYRYVTKYPAISRAEFEEITDELISQFSDINYIIRSLERKGFKKLMAIADVFYDNV